jgi:hypothetical protein
LVLGAIDAQLLPRERHAEQLASAAVGIAAMEATCEARSRDRDRAVIDERGDHREDGLECDIPDSRIESRGNACQRGPTPFADGLSV